MISLTKDTAAVPAMFDLLVDESVSAVGTIDYYRLSMLTKLGVKNVGALIKKGIQLGYID